MLYSTLKVKKVVFRQPILEAVYYSGTSDSRRDIVKWSQGFISDYNCKLYLKTIRGIVLLFKVSMTGWIVKDDTGFHRVDSDSFHKLYSIVSELE